MSPEAEHVAQALKDELESIKKKVGAGHEVKVEWLPGTVRYYNGRKMAEEVIGDTILIYVKNDQEALELVRHGLMEWILNQHTKPYRQLINKLITLFEEQQYERKEKIVETLTKCMHARAGTLGHTRIPVGGARMHEEIKKPLECSRQELEDFHRLVKKGAEVVAYGLKSRIKRAKYLAFHYEEGKLIGVVGLKRPHQEYRKKTFSKAGVPKEAEMYGSEIGWAYTEREYRHRGVCSGLIEKILEKSIHQNFFATARGNNEAIHSVLEKMRFKKIGMPYPGRFGDMQLFVRAD